MIRVFRWLEALFISAAAIFAPIQHILAVTLVFIMLDLVTGLLAAHKKGEPITSGGIRRTLSKIMVYELSLCVGFLAEHYMIKDLPLIKMISGMIALVECKSIFENLDIINGSSLLRTIIDKLGSSNQIK